MKPQPQLIRTCPSCNKHPEQWHEKAEYGSREMEWIGCKEHGHLAGGYTPGIAIQNWNHYVNRIAA